MVCYPLPIYPNPTDIKVMADQLRGQVLIKQSITTCVTSSVAGEQKQKPVILSHQVPVSLLIRFSYSL